MKNFSRQVARILLSLIYYGTDYIWIFLSFYDITFSYLLPTSLANPQYLFFHQISHCRSSSRGQNWAFFKSWVKLDHQCMKHYLYADDQQIHVVSNWDLSSELQILAFRTQLALTAFYDEIRKAVPSSITKNLSYYILWQNTSNYT